MSTILGNNLTEITFLHLYGSVRVSSMASVGRNQHEGSATIAHDDRHFYCCVRHRESQNELRHKLKLSVNMNVQTKKSHSVTVIWKDPHRVLSVVVLENKRGVKTEFVKALPSFVEFLKRIAGGLTVAEYKGKGSKAGSLEDCVSRYKPDMFADIFVGGSDDEIAMSVVSDSPKSRQLMSFVNPNATEWISRRTPSKRPTPSLSDLDNYMSVDSVPQDNKPRLESYGKRLVLAAQENTAKQDSAKGSTHSFYGTPKQEEEEDPFESPSFFRSGPRNSFLNIFGPRTLLTTPPDSSKQKTETSSPSQMKTGNTSSNTSSLRQATLASSYSASYSSQSGFTNLGNTCYMNSILQALLGLKSFADDLRKKDMLERVEKGSLYKSLHGLLVAKESRAQWAVRKAALYEVKRCLERAVERYRGGRQQDAHEFLCLLFDQLDCDVEEAIKKYAENVSFPQSLPLAVCNPVTLNFACNTQSTLSCKGCGHKHYTNEMFLTFPVALPDAKQASGVSSVQSMFNAFFDDYEVGHNCRCGHSKGTVSRSITSLPRVLVVFLKRYKLVGRTYLKRADRVRIPRILALDDLCDADVKPPHEFVCKTQSRSMNPTESSTTGQSCSPKASLDKRKQTQLGDFRSHTVHSSTTERLRARDDLYMKGVPEDEQLRIAMEQSQHASERADNIETRELEKAMKESLQKPQRKSRSDILLDDVLSAEKEKPKVITQQPQWSHSVEKKQHGRAGKPILELSEEEQLQFAIEQSKLMSNRELEVELDFERNKENRDVWISNVNIPGQLDGTDRQSPANDSTYGSDGSSPFGLVKRKSLSGEKRQRQDSNDLGLEIIGCQGAQRDSRKRLRLDGPGTEELAKQLSEAKNDSESVYQFSLSDNDDEDLVAALSNSVADTKTDVVKDDMSRAISESLKDAEKHRNERKQSDEAVARSLIEQKADKRDIVMTEEEQLRRAVELSLEEVDDVEALEVVDIDEFDDELMISSENEQKIANEKHTYRLVSVVSHLGRGSGAGHYLCDVYDPATKLWKSCDDSTVRDTEELEVRQRRSSSGYIFFYMHKQIFSTVDGKQSRKSLDLL